MSPTLLSRSAFRERALGRDNETCVIPWCDAPADDVHHVIERKLWPDGGYYMANAASVCNPHHQAAETNLIPPHAFWRWTGVQPLTPPEHNTAINKWGESFDVPPWQEHREFIKYQSSRHLPFSHSRENDDTEFREVTSFIDAPVVVTIKMDGGNASIVKDTENPVRARNAKYADHQSFDLFKQLYWENDLYSKLPENIQVFGEWLFARHSIHYGCDGCCEPRNQGPALNAYFQVFGVFDSTYNVWLSWPETKAWADRLGFPTVPVVRAGDTPDDVLFENDTELYDVLVDDAHRVVSNGHEGLVVRHTYPFHYAQFPQRIGKYVRENHVDPDATHWRKRTLKENHVG